MMDEGERLKTRAQVPDTDEWNRQMWHVRIFDQLIYNVDRNLGNLVIDKGWSVWMIDHSRAFRLMEQLKAPQDLRKIERGAFERLKAHRPPRRSTRRSGNYLTPDEKKRMLIRRDAIVQAVRGALGADAIYDAARIENSNCNWELIADWQLGSCVPDHPNRIAQLPNYSIPNCQASASTA